MKFTYVAFNRDGKKTTDVVDGESAAEVRQRLSDDGLYVVSVTAGSSQSKRSGRKSLMRASPTSCLAQFTRQMAIMVSTGTPVVQALAAVERQVDDEAFETVVRSIRERVEEGASFAESLRLYPRYFDAVAVSLVAAGEASGRLEEMLERLAVINRRQEVIRRAVSGAMMYPAMLVSISTVVLLGMIMFVVPRFAVLFDAVDTALPPTTEILMFLSDHFRASWWYEFPLAFCFLGVLFWWVRSPGGRVVVDSLILCVPAISSMVTNLAMARMARLMGVLLESRVSLLDTLVLTRAAMNNARYTHLLEQVEAAVTNGETMSSVFARSKLVSASFTEALRNGEESGKVGAVLSSLAEYLDEDNTLLIKSMTQMLEPVILIVLGLVVGSVAISMFLPLFDATAAASPGSH